MSAMLFEVTAADVAATSDDYYTPPWIFKAADVAFDMDVSAPVDPTRRTCPAKRYLTLIEDGLTQPWEGLVWMNPPFSRPHRWVDRFAEHRSGLALLPAVKRTAWLGPLMRCADAITLLCAEFGRPDGGKGEIMPLLILAACGDVAVEALSRIATADKYVAGAYHVRPVAA